MSSSTVLRCWDYVSVILLMVVRRLPQLQTPHPSRMCPKRAILFYQRIQSSLRPPRGLFGLKGHVVTTSCKGGVEGRYLPSEQGEGFGSQSWITNQECCHRCFTASWSQLMTQWDYYPNILETQTWNKRYKQPLLCGNFWLGNNLKILWRCKFNTRVLKIL